MASVAIESTRRNTVRVPNASWRMYSQLLRALGDHTTVRVAFDDGELEIMSPSLEHDRLGRLLGDMVVQIALEKGLPMHRGGSTTIRQKSKMRGLEPDECFWLASAPLLSVDRNLDLTKSPPPDLAIEIDVSSSSLDRLAIYGSLRVPEIWRWEEDSLWFLTLIEDGEYQEVERSRAFPFLRSADLMRFVRTAKDARDQTPVLKEFIAFVRNIQ